MELEIALYTKRQPHQHAAEKNSYRSAEFRLIVSISFKRQNGNSLATSNGAYETTYGKLVKIMKSFLWGILPFRKIIQQQILSSELVNNATVTLLPLRDGVYALSLGSWASDLLQLTEYGRSVDVWFLRLSAKVKKHPPWCLEFYGALVGSLSPLWPPSNKVAQPRPRREPSWKNPETS